jgi:hypothetical protein
MVLRTI